MNSAKHLTYFKNMVNHVKFIFSEKEKTNNLRKHQKHFLEEFELFPQKEFQFATQQGDVSQCRK